MKKVTNGFSRMTEASFKSMLSVIVTSMKDNPLFSTLQTEVTALQAQETIYNEWCNKAVNGGKDAILTRNASREKLIEILQVLGLQVSAIAKGDESILSASGFPFTKTKQATALLTKPQPPIVKAGINNGELFCKTKKQKGTKAISFMISTNPEDNNSWQKIFWSKTTYTFSKLTGGTRYYMKVGLLGVRGQEVISEATCYIPQ